MAAVLPSYVRRSLAEPAPPPAAGAGSLAHAPGRLPGAAGWGAGPSRADCLRETVGREVGACWPFIKAKLPQLMYGFYPESERWRVHLTYALGAALLLPLLVPSAPYKGSNAIAFFGVFPVAGFYLLAGGVLGLPEVETRVWGGLPVTPVISFTGII